jgi:hypothetical protein
MKRDFEEKVVLTLLVLIILTFIILAITGGKT